MDMSEVSENHAEIVPALNRDYLSNGLGKLAALKDEMDTLEETLRDIECMGGDDGARHINHLITTMQAFEPSVTMIGQIKSGKTTLVNAMAGRPEFLPADVNPWTSVVTSLHLNTPREAGAPKASFQFFDRNEWDHLVESGGRLGELSARAGADTELEKVRTQIAAMREKTQKRLGRKFELLLGQQHDYQDIGATLIERYTCMGDDFAVEGEANTDGQFADITKSADLYLDAPNLPLPLCIRDTPGVNDTFMMREKITIKSIRDSKICVVVLSAHQALSATDMGLIRLISSVKSRQVVIFVNRIDELSNPSEQIPEIRASLLETLASNNGPQQPSVIFGSGYWANAVLTHTIDSMHEDSARALQDYAQSASAPDAPAASLHEKVWNMSGLPALFAELSDRIVEGAGAKVLTATRKRALNYVAGLRASSSIVALRANGDQVQKMSDPEIAALLDKIESESIGLLNHELDLVFENFSERTDQVHSRFLSRALEALLQHLEVAGTNQVWQYSADGLRVLLRGGYHVMRRRYVDACTESYAVAAKRLTKAYGKIFNVTAENFVIQAPSAPEVPPPVSLAQTIALDLKSSWWSSWWKRRRGYRAFGSEFYALIEAETSPMVNELKIEQTAEIRATAHAVLAAFLKEQRNVLADMCQKSQVGMDELNDLFGVTAQDQRETLFEVIFEELNVMSDAEGEAA